LKAHLKEFITKIEIFGRGSEDAVEHAEALIGEYMPELMRKKAYLTFRRFLRKRLLSLEGRLYVLHPRTVRRESLPEKTTRKGQTYAPRRLGDTGIRIVPKGSLAAGVSGRVGKPGLRFTGPGLDKLYKKFFDKRKPAFVPKGHVKREA